eukprot:TRINITY_DN6780_c0_g1_i1.p1 TRINITY_DN6780_c0_g1~~TRINITY_DN6780_c0_g1_i1.p1  ORF type:complete len:347 (-),score=39.69 TRINITY_DN6780_c0_g1_i1:18-1058(-)
MRILVIATALITLFCIGAALSCQDDTGPTPWIVMMKFPGSVGPLNDSYASYSAYSEPKFKIAEQGLMNETSAIGKLFKQMNGRFNEISFAAWNDQPPDGDDASSSFAHSKGFIAFNSTSQQGILLQHSIPHFPRINYSKEFTQGEILLTLDDTTYSQTLLCINIDAANFTNFLQQMQVARVFIYKTNISPTVMRHATERALLQILISFFSDRKYTKLGSTTDSIQLFTKPKTVNEFLFEDVIQPVLKCDFFVESWGRPYMPSQCDRQYKTENVLTIQETPDKSWKNTQDHSKWGVSATILSTWVCISDLNRMASQAKRGGFGICIDHPGLHAAFLSIVGNVSLCEI